MLLGEVDHSARKQSFLVSMSTGDLQIWQILNRNVCRDDT